MDLRRTERTRYMYFICMHLLERETRSRGKFKREPNFSRPEIVVGTPGRLWDLISEGDSHLAKGVKDIR